MYRYGLSRVGEDRALFSRVCNGYETNVDQCQKLGSTCTSGNTFHDIAFRCGDPLPAGSSQILIISIGKFLSHYLVCIYSAGVHIIAVIAVAVIILVAYWIRSSGSAACEYINIM